MPNPSGKVSMSNPLQENVEHSNSDLFHSTALGSSTDLPPKVQFRKLNSSQSLLRVADAELMSQVPPLQLIHSFLGIAFSIPDAN